MTFNPVKTTLRHLWRFRLFTILNVCGLALSISAGWIIYRIVQFEYSYDKNLPENIYKVISVYPGEQGSKMGGISAPLYQGIRKEIPGIKRVVPVFEQWVNTAGISDGGHVRIKDGPTDIIATSRDYFGMLPYHWLAGDKETALSSPQSMVLTESRAKEYFPGRKPAEILNKSIIYYGRDTVQYTIRGVVADYIPNSQFTGKEFITLKDRVYALPEWTNTNGSDKLFLQLGEQTTAQAIVARVNRLAASRYNLLKKQDDAFSYKKDYELLPLRDVHFSTDVADYQLRKVSRTVVYGLLGMAFFLLLLACINYINISVAQIPQRTKEIGVRKTLGSSRRQLIRQFLVETWLTTVFAFVLSTLFSRAGFWLLAGIIPEGVTLFGSVTSLFLFFTGITIFLTLFAGFYPAWLVTRLKAVQVFRNTIVKTAGSRFHLQKVLIVFQFVIALVFINCAMIVGRQLRYTLYSDMGFNKDAVVLVDIPYRYLNDPRYKDRQFALADRIKKLSGVQAVALGSAPLTDTYSSSPFEYAPQGKKPVGLQTFKKWIDTTYLSLYTMKLLAGRNIHASDTTAEFIINETAARMFGFSHPQEAIGEMIAQKGNTPIPIVGVVKDFHAQDFRTKIEPLVMMAGRDELYTFNIRLNPLQAAIWPDLIREIGKEWSAFYPKDSFNWSFYDQSLEQMYKQEEQLSRLVNLATAMIIFISCLGLFGLATLSAFQRTKEIGIRKVLGASASGIVVMLSKEYALLMFVAGAIATPIAWWAGHAWLQDFAYRIHISWWLFASAALAGILLAFFTISFQAVKAALANPVKSLRSE